MEAFTARNIAKYLVCAAIHRQVASATETAITNHTRFEEDDTIVELTSHVVGWGVSVKLKPWSDRIVDRTADFINEKRAAQAAKKDIQSEET